jgi:hypothetical protein
MYKKIIRVLLIAPVLFCMYEIRAEQVNSWVELIESQSKSEIWINPGMYSYHFQKDQNLNNNNWGVGLEYRFNSVASATLGNFKNSDNGHSSYAGIYYQPIAIGFVKVGVVAGGFNGYQSTNNGGWFPAILPAITIEEGRLGGNLFFIPTVGDRVHGAISLQLKLKLYDPKR